MKDTMMPAKKYSYPFSRSVWMSLGVMAISIIVFAIYILLEQQTDRANELWYQSLSLAHELR
jgi:hypothetical protein